MDYKRGDIVLVNFNPQKKSEEIGKIRPAIILSDTKLNELLDLVSVKSHRGCIASSHQDTKMRKFKK